MRIMSKVVTLGLLLIFLGGCVEVGGSSVGVETCTGTECGEGHNTDDHSDSSTSSTSD